MAFFIFVFIPSVLANSDLPVAEIFVLAGFILIYVVEEFGHWALVRLVADKNFGRFWTFKEHKIQTYPAGLDIYLVTLGDTGTATMLRSPWKKASKPQLADFLSSLHFPSTTFLRGSLWG